MLIAIIASFALLLIVGAMRPKHSGLSRYELDRRQKDGDPIAIASARREKLLPDIYTLQRIVMAVLLVIVTMLLLASFGWLVGGLIAMIVAISYGTILRLHLIQQTARTTYEHFEERLLAFIERHPRFTRFIRHAPHTRSATVRLESREQLQYLISQSQRVLSADEKSLLIHGLQFSGRTVSEVMTPRLRIKSIDVKEMLGPLVLDDLHKTGHSRFPVVDKDIDHIVGMLYVYDLLSLNVKQSTTAEKAMDPHVYYIRQDQTLQQALMAFLRAHHHLFIVVNEEQETVGILSLEDTIESLIGHKIIDEFDSHTDLRHVARRRL